MNNIVSREIAAGRYRHLTGWKTLRVLSLPQALAFFQDLWSTYSMNRAINPPPPSSVELAALTIAETRC
jgi:hypothetical protein